jgi:amino acid adenylation domain-containing protein
LSILFVLCGSVPLSLFNFAFFIHLPELPPQSVGTHGTKIGQKWRYPLHDFFVEDEPRVASAQQRAFWLANEVYPGTPAFNLMRVLRIKGVLHKQILANAFDEIIARHEILRTSLVERDGVLLQRVHTNVRLVLEEQDLTSLAECGRCMHAEALAARMCQTAFNLALPSQFRVALLRLAEDEHLLVIVFHHAIIDGWSMGTFFDELACFYEAGRTCKTPRLPDLPLQYREFAERQEKLYARPTFDRKVDFWRNTLAGTPPVLTLPTVRPRPAVQGHRGKRLLLDVDTNLASAFRALCHRHDATLFMGLLSVFQILLQRWADIDDIVVGTATSGTRDEDLAPLIGCFVNTLVLRGNLSGDPSFSALLRRNRSASLDAFEHQEVPLERVVAEMECPRARDHSPLFQVMFVLQNFGHQVPRLAGLEIQEIDVDPGLAKLDLTLQIVESVQGDELTCSFEYDCDLFDEPMMARMADHFRRIMEEVVAGPAQRISSIALLEKGEWQRAVFDWNSTARQYAPRTLMEVFASVSAERSSDVALISEGERISFGELARRAGQVATVLRRRAVNPAEPVAVFLPRSVEAFAAILGCLLAGVPWVPLETEQPDRRLAQLVGLADCRAALTLRTLAQRLPKDVTAVPMDPDAPLWREPARTLEAPPVTDLAYVLFTSGSTGVPKGVMGTTRALMNRIDWMHEVYPFAPGEIACCKTSIGFVDAIWEMLGALLAGVPTVIIPDETVLDPEAFITLLGQHGVTRIVLVPTLLRVLLDHTPDLGRRLPALSMWSVSGEALTPDLVRRFKLACPGRKLINLYGSSEVAADVLVHEVEDTDIDGPVPIGKPVANTQVYVLDRTGQPAPVGLPGMIHAGGACLAMGYWSDPDLTAQRFRVNPIPGTPSRLLFNTGDRGFWRADGSVIYLGRTDNQVKLRGVRLELDEIVSVLRSQASVKDAAAVIVGDADSQRLIAFIVGQQGQKPPVPLQLRAYLQERLPRAAVPARLLVVDGLPLLPSGKVDQLALTALADVPAQHGAELRSFSVNADVAQIWSTVLREDDIDGADDFFDLSGNSLLAMQVIVRVRRRFGIEIPIRALFDNPTLAGFSRAVEAAPLADDEETSEIRPVARSKTEFGELRQRLLNLSPEELDALIRGLGQAKS